MLSQGKLAHLEVMLPTTRLQFLQAQQKYTMEGVVKNNNLWGHLACIEFCDFKKKLIFKLCRLFLVFLHFTYKVRMYW